MSGEEVRAMVNAINLRYMREKEATDAVRNKAPGTESGVPSVDKFTAQDLKNFNVQVDE